MPRLTDLIPGYKGAANPEISGLSADSRRMESGWLFAALSGTRADGAKFIADAVRNGAVAVLAQEGTRIPPGIDVAFAPVANIRLALSRAAQAFYARQPEVIAAVTGTNGKTSTADFCRQIWDYLGIRAASLGTLGIRGPGMDKAGSLTTPDPIALHAQLADLAAADITHLAMEASSHGLHQYRLDGVRVRAAGYTNLTRDHLDYHKTMDEYAVAKSRLFSDILVSGGTAVLNADIQEFDGVAAICVQRGVRVWGYGTKGKDLRLISRSALPQGQALKIEVFGKIYEFTLPVVGAFQVMNMLCAFGLVAAETSVAPEKIIEAIAQLKGPPGRLQLVPGHPAGAAVYVDYAHTPDALENVLNSLRPHTQGRLVCIVGCGGDRDPGKRPIMAGISERLADVTIITDDNPRTEDPAKIRAQMMAGITDKMRAREVPGRREAIHESVSHLSSGDVLVIAGKGHERGQIIGNKTEPFDDVEEAQKAISFYQEKNKK